MAFRTLLPAVVAAVWLIGLAGSVRAQTPGSCIVTRVAGGAVATAQGVGRQGVTTGLRLGPNATLRTGAGARVTMKCSDGLEVVVGPDSRVQISGLIGAGARTFGVRLIDGIAGFLFSGSGKKGVQVRTPSAVAAVRSTEWAMQVDQRASAVFTREGTVFVVSKRGQARLGPGAGVDVTATGAVGPVKSWGQARIDRFAALLGPDW